MTFSTFRHRGATPHLFFSQREITSDKKMCVRRVVSTHQSPMSLVRWGFALHHCMADGLRCCDHNHKVSARIQIAVDGSVVQRWRGQTSRAPNKDKAGPGAHRPPYAAVTRGRGRTRPPAKPPVGSAVIPEAALSASSPSRLTSRTRKPTPPPTAFPAASDPYKTQPRASSQTIALR